jgi:hypothetical protein
VQDKYGNLYANDTICRRFLKLGFPFVECHGPSYCDSRMLFEDNNKAYYRPLLTTINDWLAFGNLEERTKRDEQLEGKLLNMIKEGLL